MLLRLAGFSAVIVCALFDDAFLDKTDSAQTSVSKRLESAVSQYIKEEVKLYSWWSQPSRAVTAEISRLTEVRTASAVCLVTLDNQVDDNGNEGGGGMH